MSLQVTPIQMGSTWRGVQSLGFGATAGFKAFCIRRRWYVYVTEGGSSDIGGAFHLQRQKRPKPETLNPKL